MSTTTNSLIMFVHVHVHVLYVTTAGSFHEWEHVVSVTAGVVMAWLGMNTAKIALETARSNRLAARFDAPDAATDPMQAFTQSLSRPQANSKLQSHRLTRASLH
jgi:hypothetical protein